MNIIRTRDLSVRSALSIQEPRIFDAADELPCFRIFSQAMPPFSVSAFKLSNSHGLDARVRIPRSLIRMWFPGTNFSNNHRLSVKIDAQTATRQEDVLIWIRLDTLGQNQGRWFELTSFSKDRRCSEAVWKYVQRQQALLL